MHPSEKNGRCVLEAETGLQLDGPAAERTETLPAVSQLIAGLDAVKEDMGWVETLVWPGWGKGRLGVRPGYSLDWGDWG